MKKLIILVIFGLFLGCDNPIEVQTDKFSDISTIGIYQNYGKCDTLCVGMSVVLLNETVSSGEGYSFNYSTGADSIWDGQRWLLNEGVFLTYHTTGDFVFTVETNDEIFTINGEGTRQLFLKCNTNYNLTIR